MSRYANNQQITLRIIREELGASESKLRIDYTNAVNDLEKSLLKEIGSEQMKLRRYMTSNTARIIAEEVIPR